MSEDIEVRINNSCANNGTGHKKRVALGTKFCLSCLAERTMTQDDLQYWTRRFTGKGEIETQSDGSVKVVIA